MTGQPTTARNREMIAEAYDVFDGSRFLGTAVWRQDHWEVILRGSYAAVPSLQFPHRQAAIAYIEETAR